MGDCDSDEAENPLSGAEAPPSATEEKTSNSVNPSPAASCFSGHHGQNITHVEKDSVEANAGSILWDDAVITAEASKKSESEIGRIDRFLNREKSEEITSKNLKPPLKKKDRKVIISYKLFKSKFFTTFKLRGPFYARKDENGDEDYSDD
ncbi:hypothetical protein PHJA_001091600 [Phtheirospermum japonicum]|uniref:Uncharacterized protein n=1 Tax=Phtheirospermum japonicum TaxID=374723 RepID=A0A830BPN7_9LAMI|nr:hypothetical protein PHJA_001091600 [Phtheirospermum japonicum]